MERSLSDPQLPVVVVGGGLAGLACAVRLYSMGINVLVLEQDTRVGGRVQTDEVSGFRLDRGFQVLLTAYPHAFDLLDRAALGLRAFEPGALVYTRLGWERLADPLRRPRSILAGVRSTALTLADKARLVQLRFRLTTPSPEELFERPEKTTSEELQALKFSHGAIERFFRPFLGGVFLERELRTSSRFFEFVFRMFATGDASVPAAGMQALPDQLASRLPAAVIRTGVCVERVEGGAQPRVLLESGESITASAVILALPEQMAARLLGKQEEDIPKGRDVTCVYYSADRSPLGEATLALDGESEGPVNNLAVISDVAPSYAPPGKALISATVLGNPAWDDPELDRRCREQLTRWFGTDVGSWQLLRIYRIENALPERTAMTLEPQTIEAVPGVYRSGDAVATPSIEGAISAGVAAAEAVAKALSAEAMWRHLPAGKPSFSASFVVDAPLTRVAAFHEGPGALERLQPPLSNTRFLRVDPLAEGSVTEFEMGIGPSRVTWRAVHRDVKPGEGFTDVQESGPMRRWIHRHEYRALGSSQTLVIDRIWYQHYAGIRGMLTRFMFTQPALTLLFRYRAWATRRAVRES